jgi:hypothetical protein
MGVGLAEDVILVPLPFADCKKLSSSAQTSTLSVQVALQSKIAHRENPVRFGTGGTREISIRKSSKLYAKGGKEFD